MRQPIVPHAKQKCLSFSPHGPRALIVVHGFTWEVELPEEYTQVRHLNSIMIIFYTTNIHNINY